MPLLLFFRLGDSVAAFAKKIILGVLAYFPTADFYFCGAEEAYLILANKMVTWGCVYVGKKENFT